MVHHNDKSSHLIAPNEGKNHVCPSKPQKPSTSLIIGNSHKWISGFEWSFLFSRCRIVVVVGCYCYIFFFIPFIALAQELFSFFSGEQVNWVSKDIYYFVFRAPYRNHTTITMKLCCFLSLLEHTHILYAPSVLLDLFLYFFSVSISISWDTIFLITTITKHAITCRSRRICGGYYVNECNLYVIGSDYVERQNKQQQ